MARGEGVSGTPIRTPLVCGPFQQVYACTHQRVCRTRQDGFVNDVVLALHAQCVKTKEGHEGSVLGIVVQLDMVR